MARQRPLAIRLLARIVLGAVLLLGASFVPLVQTASARVSHKSVVLEPNQAVAGFARSVDLGMSADMVGFTWAGATEATIDVRGLAGGVWTEWLTLQGEPDEQPDKNTREYHNQVFAGPAWLGHNITSVEMRVTSGVARKLTLHSIDSEPAKTTGPGVKPAGADTPLPFIKTRADWGADESMRSDAPTYASRVDFAVVHHTVNSNSYSASDSASLVRGIYYFHTQVNGWSDIGYNFLIDRFGQIFEGRYGGINQAVIGAHAGGFNAGSTGVSLIGSFDTSAVPAPMYASLRKLLAWKLAYHNINPLGTTQHTVAASDCNCQKYPVGSTVTLPTITGHRDLDSTECPGQFMYDLLPQLRNDVAMDIGQQGRADWTCQWDVKTDYGPGTDSPLPGRIDVYVRGDDGQLWQKVQTGGGSTPWSPLGGFLTSDPDVASRSPGAVDIVVRGGDQALWLRSFDGVSWQPWQSLGGRISSSPSIVSWGPGNLSVFACGADGALWMRTFNGTWGPWSSLGGAVFAAPDVSSDGVGHLDVVVRSTGGSIYRRTFRDGVWSGWEALPGLMASGSGAGSWGPGRTDVGIRGVDRALWASAWNGTSWTGWGSLGGIITSDPDVASSGPNTLVITARGQDGAYWQRAFNGSGWLAWRQV